MKKLSNGQTNVLLAIYGESPARSLYGYKRERDGKMCFGWEHIGHSCLYLTLKCRPLIESGVIEKVADEWMNFPFVNGHIEKANRYKISDKYLHLIADHPCV